MATLFQIVGYGWALLGLGNLVMGFGKGLSTSIGVASLMFNVLLFILPGMAFGALGSNLKKRAGGRAKSDGTEEERIARAVAAALEAERRKERQP